MKNSITFIMAFMLFTVALYAQDEEAKIDALIGYHATQKRIVLDYNPFVNESKMVELFNDTNAIDLPAKKGMSLLSIINQKAFISGDWYGVGDLVDGGKIVKINPRSVQVRKDGKVIMLTFETSKNVLNIKDSKK